MKYAAGFIALLMFYCLLVVAIVFFSGFCFEYALWSCIEKDVPFVLDCVAGTAVGPVTITVAIICCVVRCCDVGTPFFDIGPQE